MIQDSAIVAMEGE